VTQPNIGAGGFGPSRRGLDRADSVIWSRQAVDDSVDPVADAVANALYWDLALPRDRVVCRCSDGWVTLSGKVERAYQRSSAEADVWRVDGVRGVTNAITVVAAAHEIGAPRAGVGR